MRAPEKTRLPLLTVLRPVCGFLPLHILNSRFLICRGFLVLDFDSIRDLLPQPLRLTFALLLEWSRGWVSLFRVRSIEQQCLLSSL